MRTVMQQLRTAMRSAIPLRLHAPLGAVRRTVLRPFWRFRYRVWRSSKRLFSFPTDAREFKRESKKAQVSKARYASYCSDSLPLTETSILYESFKGREFSGNPRALFLHLANSAKYKWLDHVIAVEDVQLFQDPLYTSSKNVTIVEHGSADYIRQHQTCKYVFNDTSFQDYITKRPGQIYIHSWHSSLLKRLARDAGRPWEAARVGRALLQTDILLSPNRFTTDHLLDSHAVDKFFEGKIAEFGYPRIDRTIHPPVALRERLGVGENDTLVLFAPTWRGQYSPENNIAEMRELHSQLKAALPTHYKVLMKLHTMTYRYLTDADSAMLVPRDVDVNELLGVTDILVTDYSGIFYDFLVTDRPIVFFMPDLDEYASTNGFYLDINTLPGPRTSSIPTLATTLQDVDRWRADFSDLYAQFRTRFTGDDDGFACERAADLIFGVSSDARVRRLTHHGESLLIFAGELNPNGVTSSFLSLLNSIDYDHVRVMVLLPKIRANQAKQASLNHNVNLIYVTGNDGLNFREYRKHLALTRYGISQERDVDVVALRRTARRALGECAFDVAVNFHGYYPSRAALFAFGVNATRRVCFLHNDLRRDMGIKHPQLAAVFSLYPYYDALACVSRQSAIDNFQGVTSFLATRYGVRLRLPFETVHNSIEPDSIRSRAAQELLELHLNGRRYLVTAADGTLSGVALPEIQGKVFVAVGRLSKEKNHRRLLRSFSIHLLRHPNSVLFVVGGGPMLNNLREFATQLGVADNVVFTGVLANPLPLLRRADCFVSSSDIEGQPITLLEALTLGCPIIATRIGGHLDLLSDTDSLVRADSESLAAALDRFAEGDADFSTDFDAEAYAIDAAAQFNSIVLGNDA